MRRPLARGSAVVTYRAKRAGRGLVATTSRDAGAAETTSARAAAVRVDRISLMMDG